MGRKRYAAALSTVVVALRRRGPKGRLAKGRLAKGRKQSVLKDNETYRTPIFCTVPSPKVPVLPSNYGRFSEAPRPRSRLSKLPYSTIPANSVICMYNITFMIIRIMIIVIMVIQLIMITRIVYTFLMSLLNQPKSPQSISKGEHNTARLVI